MRHVFADTFYWVALAHPKDQWHERAIALSKALGEVQIITTDEVLVEFLTQFSGFGATLRAKAATLTRSILSNPRIEVIPQTHETFLAGLTLYASRPDKTYSLTDCISIRTMRERNLTEALTHDEHFMQEGLRALFRDPF